MNKINYEFIELQKQAGLTNLELARKIDISCVAIDMYRKGSSKVPKTVIDALYYLKGLK